MNTTIETKPELRVATVRHVGPYHRISDAFQRLGAIADRAGLHRVPQPAMVAIYHDDPDTTPPDRLRSDAAIAVPEDALLPDGLVAKRLPAGRYARTTHVGPYSQLGDAWSRLRDECRRRGHALGQGPSYEVYRNNPGDTPAHQLRTDLYLPIA